MALIANVNSSRKRWSPSDFDPTLKKSSKKPDVKLPPKESIDILLKVFGVSNSR
jgi:trehalose-6-phosphatase